MKTLTCNQLGGACNKEFKAITFEQMAEQSKKHGMEMFQSGDKAHILAMEKMQKLMEEPKNMEKWFESKKKEFDALPDL